MPDKPDILTLPEAAEYLQISRTKLYRMAAAGEIPCIKLGRCWRFARQALLAWIANRPENAVSYREG